MTISNVATQAAVDKALEEYKEKVGKVAIKYAIENDWCDTVKEALAELGIEVPGETVEYTISFKVTSTLGSVDHDELVAQLEKYTESWISDTVADSTLSEDAEINVTDLEVGMS